MGTLLYDICLSIQITATCIFSYQPRDSSLHPSHNLQAKSQVQPRWGTEELNVRTIIPYHDFVTNLLSCCSSVGALTGCDQGQANHTVLGLSRCCLGIHWEVKGGTDRDSESQNLTT